MAKSEWRYLQAVEATIKANKEQRERNKKYREKKKLEDERWREKNLERARKLLRDAGELD